MAAPTNTPEYVKRAPTNFYGNLARTTLGQGLAFGFGDEAEAFARSLVSDKSYDELVNEVRSEIDQFRKDSPYAAYGSEIIGSLPTAILGGAGLARVGITGAAKVGGALGATYGVGVGEGDITTAEGLKSRATSGAISGAAGGAISKAASKFLPVKSEAAKKLIEKDIPLTPGQSFRDGPSIGSTLITALEDLSTSYPGAGAPIQAKRLEGLVIANRKLLEEAIEPLKIKIPSTIKSGQEAFEYVDDIISKKYDEVLSTLKLTNTKNFTDRSLDILENSLLDPTEQQRVLKILDKLVNNKIKDGVLDGKSLKNAQTELSRLGSSLSRKGGFEGEIGEVLKNIRNILDDEISLQNVNSKDLTILNQVYKNLVPINSAMQSAVIKEGIFTPAQITRAIAKSDRTQRKLKVVTGQAPLQESANLMSQVLGQGYPDSATASRLLVSDILQNPVKAIKLVAPAIVSEVAMSRVPTLGLTSLPRVGGGFRAVGFGGNPTTGLLSLPEPLARLGSPMIGANIGPPIIGANISRLASNNPTEDFRRATENN
tara:strand:+ start:1178 stop:2806 length:1629 start_codon:yes stop_codon:yes gene_type:complete